MKVINIEYTRELVADMQAQCVDHTRSLERLVLSLNVSFCNEGLIMDAIKTIRGDFKNRLDQIYSSLSSTDEEPPVLNATKGGTPLVERIEGLERDISELRAVCNALNILVRR